MAAIDIPPSYFQIKNTDWSGLIDPSIKITESVVSRLFKRYIQKSRLISVETRSLEESRITVFRRVIRNIYMETAICGDGELLQEVRDVAHIFGEDSSALFDDINTMFSLGYDPCWKLSEIVAKILFQRNEKLICKSLLRSPDGNSCDLFTECSDDILLRYRTLFHIHYKSGKQKRFLRKRQRNYQALDLNSSFFNKEVFYCAQLKYNDALRQKINGMVKLFIRSSDQPLGKMKADSLYNNITTGSPEEAENAIKAMDFITKTYSKYVKQNLIDVPEEVKYPPLMVRYTVMGTRSPRTRDKFQREIFRNLLAVPLSHHHRTHLLPSFSTSLSSNPQKNVLQLQKTTQWLFRNSDSYELFRQDIAKLAAKVNLASNKLRKGRSTLYILKGWNQLVTGKLSERQMMSVLKDLDMECVRLIRQLELKHLNAKIETFGSRDDCESSSGASSSSSSLAYSSSSSAASSTPRTPISESRTSSSSEGSVVAGSDLLTITHSFNNFSQLIIRTILTASDDKSVVTVIKNCTLLAKLALDARSPNLHVAYAVLSAFNNSAVCRLKTHFDMLDLKCKFVIERLEQLFNPAENFKIYRQYLENSEYPIIPFVGLYQRDLTFVTESEATDEQVLIVRKLVDSFYKMQLLVKASFPLQPYVSDCVDMINYVNKLDPLHCPSGWDEGEWEMMSFQDQAYHYSRDHF